LIVRSHAIPHAKILKRVEELVALLGAESFADRQRASQELIGLGAAVRPLLEQAHKRSRDPEVRQRLEDVLGKIGAGDSTSSAPELDRRMELMLKIRAANRVVLQVER
jgi:HEAT repeat protein